MGTSTHINKYTYEHIRMLGGTQYVCCTVLEPNSNNLFSMDLQLFFFFGYCFEFELKFTIYKELRSRI